MKEFFTWYMVASIIGSWIVLGYAFHLISKISDSISLLLAADRVSSEKHIAALSYLEGLIGEENARREKCFSELRAEISELK